MPHFSLGILRSLAAALLLAAGCGGGEGSPPVAPPPPPPPAPPVAAEVGLLFMGNSHTSFHGLPEMVASLVRGARPGRTVEAVEAPGWMFLEERAVDGASLRLLQGRRWSYVVLQAQKYSTSGLFDYSTEGAEMLIREARTVGAVTVMFPEWPRRGITETARIHDLHVSIARKEPACVAPIGPAWDLALARNPGLALHDADGNHSAAAGAFLAAVVIAATITGAAPDTFSALAGVAVDDAVQARLRAVAAETVLAWHPRLYCPADPVLP